MSSLINKAREKIEATLDKNSNQHNNPQSTNTGPHSSNLMNKADPYVDSDRDHRNDPTSRVGGVGSTQEYDAIHGQTTAPGGVGGVDTGYGHTTGHMAGHTAGHNAGLAPGHTVGNTVHHTEHTGGLTGHNVGHSGPTGGLTGHNTQYNEPGIGHTGGLTGHNTQYNEPGIGHTGTTGGYGGASNTYDNPQSTNSGPHRSNLMNKLDPRTDSDNDHRNDPTSRVGGYGTQTDTYGHNTGMQTDTYNQNTGMQTDNYGQNTGMHGGHAGVGHTAGHGPGMTGTHGHSSITPGSGTAPNTAGPHNSDLLNKLDPRVDADMDGSKTYGGNATHR